MDNMNLEIPDCGASYVKSDKRDYCIIGLCAAKTLDEVKSCANYDPSILFNAGGCDHLAPRSGKCLKGGK